MPENGEALQKPHNGKAHNDNHVSDNMSELSQTSDIEPIDDDEEEEGNPDEEEKT